MNGLISVSVQIIYQSDKYQIIFKLSFQYQSQYIEQISNIFVLYDFPSFYAIKIQKSFYF